MSGRDDEFDDVVLDEEFVRAGRPEPSALERQASRARARSAAGGRREETGPILPPRPRRRPRHRLRLAFGLLAVTLGALVLVVWTGQNRAGAERVRASGPQTVGADPAAAPQRLVALPPDPGGEGGFAFLGVQDDVAAPVAFDPCRPVTYVVRRDGELPGGDALLEEAVAEVAAATGLRFVRGPDTTEAPSPSRPGELPGLDGPGPAPVLIAWSDEAASPDLAGDVTGVAAPTGGRTDASGSQRWLSGQVVLDADDLGRVLAGSGGRGQVRATVLHELGHLVGLAHVPDPGQLMHSESGAQEDFAAGDLRGLRALGSGACFTDW